MMKKMMSFKIIKILFIVNIVLIILEFFIFDMKYIFPLEIGFISSSLIILASLKSYKTMVNTRIEYNIITLDDDRDELDKLEDPYDLYSDDNILEEEKDLVEVVKEERAKLKSGRSILQVIKDTKPAISFLRLGAYIVLILGFFYLNRHNLLHIPTYIIALGIPSIVTVFVLVFENKRL